VQRSTTQSLFPIGAGNMQLISTLSHKLDLDPFVSNSINSRVHSQQIPISASSHFGNYAHCYPISEATQTAIRRKTLHNGFCDKCDTPLREECRPLKQHMSIDLLVYHRDAKSFDKALPATGQIWADR
jgi:hypothetical protein